MYVVFTTFMCRLSRNSGVSTSWNPKGISRPVAGKLYLFMYFVESYGKAIIAEVHVLDLGSS
jgi:hypothetical protein